MVKALIFHEFSRSVSCLTSMKIGSCEMVNPRSVQTMLYSGVAASNQIPILSHTLAVQLPKQRSLLSFLFWGAMLPCVQGDYHHDLMWRASAIQSGA